MTRPGVELISRETPPARSAATDTGIWFVAGFTEKGNITTDPQVPITSMATFERIFGQRLSYSATLYDSLETFFREGGGKAHVSRVVGPAPVSATVNIPDGAGTPVTSLVATATGPGDWGNALNVDIDAGVTTGTFIVTVSHDTDGTLEQSGELADQDAAVAWASKSDYIRLTKGASTQDPAPTASPLSLAGGTDNRASATDATWEAALDRFPRDLGPGQVSMPGRTSDQAHLDLLEHAANYRRVALLDLPDTATKATLLTSVAAAQVGNERFGGAFAPWAVIPGVAPNTTRTVPYSAVQAGLIARSDGAGKSPNQPAAGENGQAQYAIGLSQAAWTDADREDLNEGGVNVAITKYGGVRTYGYRSLADPEDEEQWLNLGNARLYMAIAAKADAIGEGFIFREIDGKGLVIMEFAGVLTGMLMDYYVAGSLYGETPQEAFQVNVGPQVNTPETIADSQLRAVISLKMSPFAELVVIELVKTRITEAL